MSTQVDSTNPKAGERRRLGARVGRVLAALGVVAGSFVLAGPTLAATSRSTTRAAHRSVDVSAVAAQADPAIVDINTTLPGGAAAGTGMLLTSSGEVLTNNHVIDGATSVAATTSTGKTYDAKAVGYDATDDVAVLQLQGASKLPTITAAGSQPAVGDSVLALGNALGRGGTPAAVEGTVTALNQTVTAADNNGANPETLHGMIQIDANIQPGDSGGPLVNANGEVVGMDSAGSSQQPGFSASRTDTGSGSTFGPGSGSLTEPGFGSGGSGGSGSGSSGSGVDPNGGSGSFGGGSGSGSSSGTVGFAVPIQNALSIAHQIESGNGSGNVTVGTRAILGVEVQDAQGSSSFGASGNENGGGVQISGVQSGTPAASAGLAGGDVIVSVDGHSVSSASDISSTLAKHHPGDRLQVDWLDNSGQRQQATIALVAGPPA